MMSVAPFIPARPLRRKIICFMAVLAALLHLFGCEETSRRNGSLQVGDKAPDFTVTDRTGGKINLQEWTGKTVILRFWSTDCVYCRADTPIFNEYFHKYRDKGLRVIYFNTGASPEEIAQFVSDLAIPFPVVMDEDGAVAALYRVKIVPQTIIIGPDQKIVAAVLGGVGKAELQKLLGKYLDKGGSR